MEFTPQARQMLEKSFATSRSAEQSFSMHVKDDAIRLKHYANGDQSVRMPKGEAYTLHTHPWGTQVYYQCFHAWPSQEDFAYVYRASLDGLVFSAVYTVDGLYVIRVDPDFREYGESHAVGAGVLKKIKSQFTDYHAYRCVGRTRIVTPRQFVEFANSFTFNGRRVFNVVLSRRCRVRREFFSGEPFYISHKVVRFPSP